MSMMEENINIVRRWNDTIWDTNVSVDTFDELLHPEYANRSMDNPPWSVGLQGVQAMKDEVLRGRKHLGMLENRIEDIVADGDRVALRLTAVLHGKPIARVMVFYRLLEGKIIDDWFTWIDIPEKVAEQAPAKVGEAR